MINFLSHCINIIDNQLDKKNIKVLNKVLKVLNEATDNKYAQFFN